VHGASGEHRQRLAVPEADPGSGRNRAVAPARENHIGGVVFGGTLELGDEVVLVDDAALELVPGRGENLGRARSEGVHVEAAEGPAVAVEDADEAHANSRPAGQELTGAYGFGFLAGFARRRIDGELWQAQHNPRAAALTHLVVR